jgi:SAM-dependent methyltransferase
MKLTIQLALIPILIFPKATIALNGKNSAAFERIYAQHGWGTAADGSPSSGTGSTAEATSAYREFLQTFLREKEIRSVVDLGCGDWQISRLIDWSGIQYLGLDASKYIVNRNRQAFAKDQVRFAWSTGENLPSADLLIVKDVLQHLPNSKIKHILSQINKFKYCLITNDCESTPAINEDITFGAHRPLDLTAAPFFIDGYAVLQYQCPTGETKRTLLVRSV